LIRFWTNPLDRLLSLEMDMVVPTCFAGLDAAAARFTQPRLGTRLQLLFGQLHDRLDGSLPQACRSEAAYKGATRFFDHPQTAPERLLPALVRPAVRNACGAALVLVAHDSTSFNYSSLQKAQGLGPINDSARARGFHLHSSLLLDGEGALLGIAHLHFWTRQGFRQESDEQVRSLPIEAKESFKWLRGLRATQAAFTAETEAPPRLVHVMDREGDIHEVFADVRRLRQHAVIRCAQDRRVEGEEPDQVERAHQRVARYDSLGRIEVRVPCSEGGHRLALCEVRAAQVRLSPAAKKYPGRRPLRLGLIEIREVTPPADQPVTLWRLWTTLPVRTPAQIVRVLDAYRARWRLEEYHRVLKTSLRVEKLRLQSGEKLMKALTLAAGVAVRVVQLRDRLRQVPEESCREWFGEAEWQTLWTWKHGRPWTAAAGVPTLAEVVRWVARLGGHLGRKCDGSPGAEVLSRGLRALALMREGRELGRAEAGAAAPPGGAGTTAAAEKPSSQ
jgi:hypothetical protein